MRSPRRIYERICAERITALTQLEPAEQAVLRATPALLRAIRENQALLGIAPTVELAPERPALVEQALRAAQELEERRMTPITRLILGKRWYVQAAFGTAIIFALVTLALVLPRPGAIQHNAAWAMAEGYVLAYDLGPLPAEHCDNAEGCQDLLAGTPLADVEAALKAWKAEQPTGGESTEERVLLSVKLEDGRATLTVAMLNANGEWVTDFAQALAEIPGLPEPELQPATWYFDDAQMLAEGKGLELNILNHRFCFPETATETEIEATVNDWLKEQHLEENLVLDVTIDRVGDELRLMARLEEAGDS